MTGALLGSIPFVMVYSCFTHRFVAGLTAGATKYAASGFRVGIQNVLWFSGRREVGVRPARGAPEGVAQARAAGGDPGEAAPRVCPSPWPSPRLTQRVPGSRGEGERLSRPRQPSPPTCWGTPDLPALARRADVVISSLPGPVALLALTEGPLGILAHPEPDTYLRDTSTADPPAPPARCAGRPRPGTSMPLTGP